MDGTSPGETPLNRGLDTPDHLGRSYERSNLSMRRRLTLDENDHFSGTRGPTQYTQYGKTPNVIRRIRAARSDIGDMGRELYMQPEDIRRLPYLLDGRIEEVQNRFSAFLREFRLEDYVGIITPTDNDYELLDNRVRFGSHWNTLYYGLKMMLYIDSHFSNASDSNVVSSTLKRRFEVNMLHIQSFDCVLYTLLVKYPADCVGELDRVLVSFFDELTTEYLSETGVVIDQDQVQWTPRVRLFGKPDPDYASLLGPRDIDTLVCLKGIVVRCSDVIPEMTMAAFRCLGQMKSGINTLERCTQESYDYVIQGEVNEPTSCAKCKNRNCFELWHNMCCFASKQLIKIIELPQSSSESPQSVIVYAYDDLIDNATPGDRVEVTGIFKTSPIRVNPRMRTCHAIYRTFINALHIRLEESSRNKMACVPRSLGPTDSGLSFSQEIINTILHLSKSPNIYDLLVKSFAPSIQGHEDIKRGLLCQLFGASVDKNSRMRSQINVLLCGDPSTSKSQMLRYVHMLAPRGVYTSGKGSSQVGLTAYVRKDVETHEYVLESGAVVLSDGGICCIDEFDKMDDFAKSILHEVMEQQTVTIAKAGIVATLNARTAILASANPINSRYDKSKAVVENINLAPSLFSRFDLIYLVLDCIEPSVDKAIAKRLCNSFAGTDDENPPIDAVTLSRYISFARAHCNPYLTPESRQIIVSEYLKLRVSEGYTSKLPCATARQLEGLIRLSQALAKMKLSPRVTASDAREAARLMKATTFQSLIDPISGKIDFDQLATGLTAAASKRSEQLCDEILSAISFITTAEPFATLESIYDRCKGAYRARGEYLERRLLLDAVDKLLADNKIARHLNGYKAL